jgi:zinc protease
MRTTGGRNGFGLALHGPHTPLAPPNQPRQSTSRTSVRSPRARGPDRLARMRFGAVILAVAAFALPARATPNEAAANAPSPPSTAPPVTPVAVSSTAFEIPFTKYTLKNGLEVILHKDPHLPMVAVNVWYHVGPVNEPAQRSGFAHLFEHLMFGGSKYVGDRFDTLLEAAGGTNMNGTTSWDRTNYYETVPREQLELALWLESDRMGFMIDALTQEKLDVQREVVKNERRQSYENQPYGPSTLALYDALFPEGHPYHGAVIGSMDDLSRATLQDVQEFFKRYYAPRNATLVLAGNFDEAVARAHVDKYFGTLPARSDAVVDKAPARSLPQVRLPIRIEKLEEVALPRVLFAWTTPPAYSKTEPALDLAARILTSGKASRLYQALVARGIANSVDASIDANQVTSVFELVAKAASGHTHTELESELSRHVAGLAQVAPSEAELARAKSAFELELKSTLQRLNADGGESGRAGLLQRFNHYLKDPGALSKWLAAYQAVTPADVQQAVAEYLRPEKQVLVVTLPGVRVPPPAAPAATAPAATAPAAATPPPTSPAAPPVAPSTNPAAPGAKAQ